MILPDVNTLVYAFRIEAPRHAAYARWLQQIVNGTEDVALVDSVLAGFLRIVTNARIYDDPAPASAALSFVAALRSAPRARWLPPGASTWTRLAELVDSDPGIRGDIVPDAYLAATAIAHGCRIATADRGFGRFPGLDWFVPVEPRPA